MTKIRNQSALLIAVIGVAILLFILGDIFKPGSSLFGGQEDQVGSINGKKIPYRDFQNMVQIRTDDYKQSRGVSSIDENTAEQIRNQVWNELVQDEIFFNSSADMGCNTTYAELMDMINGNNTHPYLKQFFRNEQGQYQAGQAIQFIQNLDQQPMEQQNAWKEIEKSILSERTLNKYFNLIKKGLNASKLEAQNDFKSKREKLALSYVGKKYSDIPNQEVSFDESDLEKYYKEHSWKPNFQMEESKRDMEFVLFSIEATQEDKDFILNELTALKSDFIEAENDTLFVLSNASDKNNIKWYRKGSLTSEADSAMFSSKKGDTYGPYYDPSNETFNLAKLLDKKVAPDSAKARHILISTQNKDSATAKNTIDSLKMVIDGGIDFGLVAAQNSEDPGSKDKGGEYDWFTEGRMVKEFNDACFNGKVGDRVIVQTSYGFHLIEITGQTDPVNKILVAVVDRPIEASKTTLDNVYNQASKFAINSKTSDLFTQNGNDLGIRSANDLKETELFVSGIGEAKELVRWAFDAEKDQISGPLELEDKFVVARLVKIKEKGTLPLDVVKAEVEAEVIKEKKFEKIKTQLEGINDLNAAAGKLGTAVEETANVSFSTYSIPGLGAERELLGTLFGLPQGKVSGPYKGRFGVYMVQVVQKEEVPSADYTANMRALREGLVRRVDYEVFEELKNIAKVEDNRAKFY